jgi:hypothetical protein
MTLAPMFGIFVFAIIAALVALAIWTNRNGKHAVGALLWMCAGTVLVWGALIWLMRR